jgi:hypothetical protein
MVDYLGRGEIDCGVLSEAGTTEHVESGNA